MDSADWPLFNFHEFIMGRPCCCSAVGDLGLRTILVDLRERWADQVERFCAEGGGWRLSSLKAAKLLPQSSRNVTAWRTQGKVTPSSPD